MSHTNPHESAPRAPHRLLRLPATLDRVALGRTAWLDLVREGLAPKPIRNGRATAWVEAEIDAWIETRIRASRGAA